MEKLNKKVNIILSVWVALLFLWIGSISYISARVSDRLNDSIHYYKVLDSNTRSIPKYDITQDTAYIRKMEEEIKKLLE